MAQLSKTFVLNIENLNTPADATRIETYFMEMHGVERVDIEMSLNLVSIRYNEELGSPNKILSAFEVLGYPVR